VLSKPISTRISTPPARENKNPASFETGFLEPWEVAAPRGLRDPL